MLKKIKEIVENVFEKTDFEKVFLYMLLFLMMALVTIAFILIVQGILSPEVYNLPFENYFGGGTRMTQTQRLQLTRRGLLKFELRNSTGEQLSSCSYEVTFRGYSKNFHLLRSQLNRQEDYYGRIITSYPVSAPLSVTSRMDELRFESINARLRMSSCSEVFELTTGNKVNIDLYAFIDDAEEELNLVVTKFPSQAQEDLVIYIAILLYSIYLGASIFWFVEVGI